MTPKQMRALADALEALVSPDTPNDSVSTSDAVATLDAAQDALRAAADQVEAQKQAMSAAEDFQIGTEVTDAMQAAIKDANRRSWLRAQATAQGDQRG
jgi:hypothetical protein